MGNKYIVSNPKLVLTHGDITGLNIILSEEGLKLTDWDGACYAPKERDFIFLFDNPNFSLEQYFQLTGEKYYDPLLKEFYNLDWALNSIIGNFENLINTNKSKDDKQECFDEIIEYLSYY